MVQKTYYVSRDRTGLLCFIWCDRESRVWQKMVGQAEYLEMRSQMERARFRRVRPPEE